ncbi:hypothetical protein ASPZODRAFT_76492 [Penicilliopsis zonata CBS 506.65]|uniref:Major facilitator superfamily (MFS) profile domain-containing protein n=1 Tax=Penicilliopsis zonata CBS 506.65 TaxID=1073090 RepID=A0A1L9S5W3_9EURO|nr:hypothetical protein ASPZODRAFT_76492 [Penicilliopsis zonata CBS 506.65]OJJ42559.1 hypothetical protein ASPZODRAFT_76492 [Penicilliopsis zonata CBS 506.65]
MAQDKPAMSTRERFQHFTPMVAFITFYMSICAFNFGYDVGNFSGVQGMSSFARQFGKYDAKTDTWAIPGYLSSIMTSMPFFGKAIGAACCGWIAERYGRKVAVAVLAITSLVGVLLQVSATTAGQFTLGRVINFGMTGFTIVVVPIYQAECAPKAIRGLCNSTLQMMIMCGQTIASLVVYGTEKLSGNKAWQIPTGLQFLVPLILLALLPLIPESPRWLLARHRIDEATISLRRLRGEAVSNDRIEDEIQELQLANTNDGKGSWQEVFSKKNKRRTTVAILAMFGQQITGQAFISQYSVVFYEGQGFGSKSFLFNIINNVCGVAGTIIAFMVVDGMGRRPLLLVGGALMGTFLLIVGGISTNPHPPQAARNTMVASLALYTCMFCVSWAPVSYVVLSESAASRVKEKTNLLACIISVLTTFVTTFTMPYLIDAGYGNLGGKVGFVYGSICWAYVVVTWFGIPELKGRTLEEVDYMFDSGARLWQFSSIRVPTREEESVESVVGK